MSGSAIIFGASGGIGGAIADAVTASGAYQAVHRLSRRNGDFDLTDEATIAAVAARLANGPAPRLVIVATGMLHADGRTPEKSLRMLDAAWLAECYAVNAIGPALIAKHMLPLLPREGRSVFAALSARVGSISDNRLGGWHGYRAAKAALNMLIRNFALELATTRKEAVCVGLHPGTVDTALSAPFQRGVTPEKLFRPEQAAGQLLSVIKALTPQDSGGCFAWDGARIPA